MDIYQNREIERERERERGKNLAQCAQRSIKIKQIPGMFCKSQHISLTESLKYCMQHIILTDSPKHYEFLGRSYMMCSKRWKMQAFSQISSVCVGCSANFHTAAFSLEIQACPVESCPISWEFVGISAM